MANPGGGGSRKAATLKSSNSSTAALLVTRLGRMWRGEYGEQKPQQWSAAKRPVAIGKRRGSEELRESFVSSGGLGFRVFFFFKRKFLIGRYL